MISLNLTLRTAACQWIDLRNACILETEYYTLMKPLHNIQMTVFENPDEGVISKQPNSR